MNTEDLKILAEMGMALWAEPDRVKRATVDTLMAASLQALTPEGILERTISALLQQAEGEGIAANTQSNLAVIDQPFFRLYPRDRLLLVATHRIKWTYARIGKALGETEVNIEEQVWNARLQLAAASGLAGKLTHSSSELPKLSTLKAGATYPVGAFDAGPRCPDYNIRRPWTQKFLDDEIKSGRDRLFLQNHVMACDGCRRSLNQCREMYFKVESMIPAFQDDKDLVKNLFSVNQKTRALVNPAEMSLLENFIYSLVVFFERTDARIGLIALLSLMLYALFRR